MATPKKSLYEILGLDRDANAIDVGLMYDRRRAELAVRVSDRALHPGQHRAPLDQPFSGCHPIN